MSLTLILGPMKSGKSYELISIFAPLKYSKIKFGLYQSKKNTRDSSLTSRNGVNLEAKKIKSLSSILKDDVEIVGIDEIHMFEPKDILAIKKLLKKNVKVVVSGLDTDYRGVLFETIAKLFELIPEKVKYKKAICDICKENSGIFTQILKNDKPVTKNLPSVLAEDQRYKYLAVCRKCFVQK